MLRFETERRLHESSCFATLTYDDEHVPRNDLGWTCLDKRHLVQLFKKMRKNCPPFRYYAIGEYGTKTHRAHYHVFFFGLDFEECHDFLDEFWNYGHHRVTPINGNRIGYVANFHIVAKRRINASTEQTPEFTLCSKGLGVPSDNQLQYIRDHHQMVRNGFPMSVPRYWEKYLSEYERSALREHQKRFHVEQEERFAALTAAELAQKKVRQKEYTRQFLSKSRKNRK